jgi:Raf kinase inhibitor-like YbhB/YbcL family protein
MRISAIVWLLILIVVIVGGIAVWTRSGQNTAAPSLTAMPTPAITNQLSTTMKLTSFALNHNGTIPPQYTCDGANISPPLAIADVPAESKSLTLIMDDPDAPVGTWDHWVVFNIPPNTTEIPEGQEPVGVHGQGTADNVNYTGPCPPDREHRYFFKLYALDTMLDLSEGVRKADVERAMEGRILDQAELVGRYNRS